MGDFENHPQATTRHRMPRITDATGDSFFVTWYWVAKAITNASPLAANGVNLGRIRTAEGRMKPNAASISLTPINRTVPTA